MVYWKRCETTMTEPHFMAGTRKGGRGSGVESLVLEVERRPERLALISDRFLLLPSVIGSRSPLLIPLFRDQIFAFGVNNFGQQSAMCSGCGFQNARLITNRSTHEPTDAALPEVPSAHLGRLGPELFRPESVNDTKMPHNTP